MFRLGIFWVYNLVFGLVVRFYNITNVILPAAVSSKLMININERTLHSTVG